MAPSTSTTTTTTLRRRSARLATKPAISYYESRPRAKTTRRRKLTRRQTEQRLPHPPARKLIRRKTEQSPSPPAQGPVTPVPGRGGWLTKFVQKDPVAAASPSYSPGSEDNDDDKDGDVATPTPSLEDVFVGGRLDEYNLFGYAASGGGGGGEGKGKEEGEGEGVSSFLLLPPARRLIRRPRYEREIDFRAESRKERLQWSPTPGLRRPGEEIRKPGVPPVKGTRK